jgi:hypothetical protein
MLTGTRNQAMALAIITLLCGVVASEAHAESGRYGAVCIHNPTDNVLSFQMRLGNTGPWEDFEVAPMIWQTVYFDLDHNGRAYPPQIRFDYVAGDGCFSERVYELEFYEVTAPNWHEGFDYEFEYNTAGDRLDLYKLD